MNEFTKSLAPTINEAMSQAIAKHVERMHADFALLAELTKDAKSYEEIAQRFVDMGLVKTHQPSDSVVDYQNVCEEFVSKVAPLLWMPERDEHWNYDVPDFPARSESLQTYLAKKGEE